MRYLVSVWLACLSVDSWLFGESTPNEALAVTLSVAVAVLGAVWAFLVARRGRSRAALFALPAGASVLATVLTSIAVYSDPDNGLDSFYPVFFIPFYLVILGVPVWLGGSIGGIWRLVANRRDRSTDEPRAQPSQD